MHFTTCSYHVTDAFQNEFTLNLSFAIDRKRAFWYIRELLEENFQKIIVKCLTFPKFDHEKFSTVAKSYILFPPKEATSSKVLNPCV